MLDTNNVPIVLCSRIFASLIAGLALGVVGYAGWSGFLWYFLAHALVIFQHFERMPACQRGCSGNMLDASCGSLGAACHPCALRRCRTIAFGLPAIQVGALLRYKTGKDMKPFFQSQ